MQKFPEARDKKWDGACTQKEPYLLKKETHSHFCGTL